MINLEEKSKVLNRRENMFNEKQLEFINTLDGRVALISVAGSGKTSSTIERI